MAVASYGLAYLGDPRAIGSMIRAIPDGKLAPQARVFSDNLCDLVTQQGSLEGFPDFSPVVSYLTDPDGVVRVSAAQILGHTQCLQALEPLSLALKDPYIFVRAAAGEALGTLGGPRAVQPLLSALLDDNSVVRNSAVLALGAAEDPSAIEALRKASSEDDRMRASACRTLVCLGVTDLQDEIAEVLKDVPSDDDVSNWQQVAEALGFIGTADSLETFLVLLRPAMPAPHEDSQQKLTPEVTSAILRAMSYLEKPPDLEAMRRLSDISSPCEVESRERLLILRYFPFQGTPSDLEAGLNSDKPSVQLAAASTLAIRGERVGLTVIDEVFERIKLGQLKDVAWGGKQTEYMAPGQLVATAGEKVLPSYLLRLSSPVWHIGLYGPVTLSRLPEEALRKHWPKPDGVYRLERALCRLEKFLKLRHAGETRDLATLREMALSQDIGLSIIACGFLYENEPDDAVERARSWLYRRPEWVREFACYALYVYADLFQDEFLARLQDGVSHPWKAEIRRLRRFIRLCRQGR
ncbi:MAG: HEAT repeat domain-containing protein [Planctomycetes bacterium]|nr:HEAT repeat domain-containing protein [Planctomycetota bacterium]